MSIHLNPVVPEKFDDEVRNCPLPVIVIYWDTRNTDYKIQHREVGMLAEEYAGKVKVITVEVNDAALEAWMFRTRDRYQIYGLPHLQVFKTQEERAGRDPTSRIERSDFRPGLKAMFHYASHSH